MRSGPSRKAWPVIGWSSSLPALLAASFFYYPYAFTGPVLCPMALVLGLPCPGCGLTRAFCLMTHGQFAEALRYHALAPAMLGYLAFLWVYKIIESVRGAPPRLPTSRIGAAAGLVVAGFWVVRLAAFFAQGGLQVMARDNLLARLARLIS